MFVQNEPYSNMHLKAKCFLRKEADCIEWHVCKCTTDSCLCIKQRKCYIVITSKNIMDHIWMDISPKHVNTEALCLSGSALYHVKNIMSVLEPKLPSDGSVVVYIKRVAALHITRPTWALQPPVKQIKIWKAHMQQTTMYCTQVASE